MNEKNKDTDLREALRRKYADTPQLPADFMVSMQQKMASTPQKRSKVTLLWMAVAACLVFIIGVGVTLMHTDNSDKSNMMTAQQLATAKEAWTDALSHQENDSFLVGKHHSQAEKTLFPLKENIEKPILKQVKITQDEAAQPTEDSETMRSLPVNDPNLHYAAHVVTEDTMPYQAPGRMNEFIAKMANYNSVDCNVCSDEKDTTVVSTAYIFDDKEEQNLFPRLLQAACWYDSKTPGYLLSYSHQQFFFCLKDLRLGLKYLWIAERVNGKILLYCSQSPIDTEVSSECFQKYRDRLTNTSTNKKTTEI